MDEFNYMKANMTCDMDGFNFRAEKPFAHFLISRFLISRKLISRIWIKSFANIIFAQIKFRANLILAKIYAIVTDYHIFDSVCIMPNTGAMAQSLANTMPEPKGGPRESAKGGKNNLPKEQEKSCKLRSTVYYVLGQSSPNKENTLCLIL